MTYCSGHNQEHEPSTSTFSGPSEGFLGQLWPQLPFQGPFRASCVPADRTQKKLYGRIEPSTSCASGRRQRTLCPWRASFLYSEFTERVRWREIQKCGVGGNRSTPPHTHTYRHIKTGSPLPKDLHIFQFTGFLCCCGKTLAKTQLSGSKEFTSPIWLPGHSPSWREDGILTQIQVKARRVEESYSLAHSP